MPCLFHQEWSPEANRSINRKDKNIHPDDVVTLTNIVSASNEASQIPQDTIR